MFDLLVELFYLNVVELNFVLWVVGLKGKGFGIEQLFEVGIWFFVFGFCVFDGDFVVYFDCYFFIFDVDYLGVLFIVFGKLFVYVDDVVQVFGFFLIVVCQVDLCFVVGFWLVVVLIVCVEVDF